MTQPPTDHFNAIYRELQAASDANQVAVSHLAEAGQALLRGAAAMTQSHDAITRAFNATAHTEGEREDLRETVQQLQVLVMDLARELRDRKNGQNGGAS